MYNCPADFDDGLPIDYRAAGLDISDAVARLKKDGGDVDVRRVDGWHTYECASRDLAFAYGYLERAACWLSTTARPRNGLIASPTFVPGEWSGVSYRSYLDFVLVRSDLDYCTVDVDYGCGIIIKNQMLDVQTRDFDHRQSELIDQWLCLAKDDEAFDFFSKHRSELLRLISARDFVSQFR